MVKSFIETREAVVILAAVTLVFTLVVAGVAPAARAANSVSFTLSGVSLKNTCNPHCADLTGGTLQGWAEGDWVPYDLAINVPGGPPYTGPVIISLDYNLTHNGIDYGIDSFAACGGHFPDGSKTASGQCGNGDIPLSGSSSIGKVLLDGVPVAPNSVTITGTKAEIVFTLSTVSLASGTHHIQWANHLAFSGGSNLANTQLGFSSEPLIHANGASHWPGARIHESAGLGGINGVRSVPILKPGLGTGTENTLDISTTVVDDTVQSSDPNNFVSGNSFFDTANLTANTPVDGSIVYHFFNGSSCDVANETTYFNGVTWPNTVTIANDGSVPNSQSTGPLVAGDYSFMANYSGTFAGTVTNECEPFTVQQQVFPPPPPTQLTAIKTANGNYTTTYSWGVSKSANATQVNTTAGSDVPFNYTVSVTHDNGTNSSINVNGTITVFNQNSAPVVANVTDKLSDGTVCSVTDGQQASIGNPSTSFKYICHPLVYPQGQLNNTVTVTWATQSVGSESLAAGSANYTFAGVSLVRAKVINGCVTVKDQDVGPIGSVCNTDPSPKNMSYVESFHAPSGTCNTHDNTVLLTNGQGGPLGSASKTVTYCGGLDLTVSKTANPYFNRTYTWSIAKYCNSPLDNKTNCVVTAQSGSTIVPWNVVVNETGFTDSMWKVNGTITVHNPNDWENITLASITDVVNNGGSCTVASGPNVVNASQSAQYKYNCAYATKPNATSGINNATITWNPIIAHTSHGSASGTAQFAFTIPTTTKNKIVHVSDLYNGGQATLLGTVTGIDTMPFNSSVFDQSKSVTVPSAGCVAVTNTGKIVETGQQASASATACPQGFVTNSAFCPIPANTTNLIYVQYSGSNYLLTASNPGQFYYNVMYTGAPGSSYTLNLNIPWPFVTQGAHPIQTSSSFTLNSGGLCISPSFNNPGTVSPTGAKSSSGFPILNLTQYSSNTLGTTKTITVTGTVPASGLVYVTVHLDYGLKKMLLTQGVTQNTWNGYTSVNASYPTTSPTANILNGQGYYFSTTGSGGFNTSFILHTINTYKKDPGFGGVVINNVGSPIVGATVKISIAGKSVATVTTDSNGFYSYAYKYTGGSIGWSTTATYNSQILTQSGTMKSNSLVIANFQFQ